MKSSELKLKKDGYKFNCKSYKAGSHYKALMLLGRLLPCTQPQAKYFISNKVQLSVLNGDDVEKLESVLNKHGFEGSYKYTKSKTWVRIQNHEDLYKALKLEFNI